MTKIVAASLLASAFVTSAPALAKNHSFKVTTHTSSEQAFAMSSYIVESGGEILLVDSHMMNNESDTFIKKAKAVKGKVKTIYVTHAHPDHYFGLQKLKAAFPEAKIIAKPETADAIAQAGAGTLKFFREQFAGGALKDNLPTEIVTPEKLDGDTVKVGQTELQILSFPEAESKYATGLYHKASGSFLAGDLAYNNVHLWLKDTPPKGWIAALETLKGMKLKKVYPGHGAPGTGKIIEQNIAYLMSFQKAVDGSRSGDELAQKVKNAHPKMKVPGIVDFAVPSYFPPAQTEAKADAAASGNGSAAPAAAGTPAQ